MGRIKFLLLAVLGWMIAGLIILAWVYSCEARTIPGTPGLWPDLAPNCTECQNVYGEHNGNVCCNTNDVGWDYFYPPDQCPAGVRYTQVFPKPGWEQY